MAAMKKFAGLPDVDLEQEEIYETQVPDLTEASTVQETEYTDSASDHSDFDTTALNPSGARALFEPSIVDATNVNFSDTITGRRSYRTRRRRKIFETGPETVRERLARLQRETIELESQLQQAEEDDEEEHSSYEDTLDHPQEQSEVTVLRTRLETLAARTHSEPVKGSLEDEFIRRLDDAPKQRERPDVLPQSTISAIAQFGDRLAALENTLGISSATPVESVVPMLNTLSSQIDVLASTLSPRSEKDAGTAYLESVASKISELVKEAEKLEKSRRGAAKAFEELLETRDRHAHVFQSHSAVHAGTETRLRQQEHGDSSAVPRKEDVQQQFTHLFLDDQAAKIDALYHVLPTIQDLQPLLPVVLERLRALNVIHSGAADVKEDLDEMERRMAVQEEDIKKWRQGVEKAEAAMQDGTETIKNNVQIIGNAVRALEQRVQALKQ